MKLKIAITHGDINGIGYEVILKALEDARMLEICTPIIYGSAKIAAWYMKQLGIEEFPLVQIHNPDQARDNAVNIINVVGEDVHPHPGETTAESGRAALAALNRAVADLRDGDVDALVTAPIDKHAIQSPEFQFPGHTEYLETNLSEDTECRALMVMCNSAMRVAMVTAHTPLAKIPEAITKDTVLQKIKDFNRCLHRDFAITTPRIAVLALNPHAGEGGLLGSEEANAIAPAIAEAAQQGILAFGPYPSDGFFGAGTFAKFDGILAMYHDQGLIPFKTMAMDEGVNFTAGLPHVRTSPDHGTACDIAGRGIASEASMRNAIYTAVDIVRARRNEDHAHRDPLRKHYRDRPERPERPGKPKSDKKSGTPNGADANEAS